MMSSGVIDCVPGVPISLVGGIQHCRDGQRKNQIMDGPRACQPEEDVEIGDLLNAVFREGTGQDVRTDYPLVFDPAMLHNRRIVKLDGKVVAHVPILARNVISGIDGFTVALISGTLTHPDYRRRGLATRCLMDAVRIMDEQGWPVSVLWTVEPTFPFYQNSGWEAVSSQGRVYRVCNSEAHLFRAAPFDVVPYDPEDRQQRDAVKAIHDAEPQRIGRSVVQHDILFSLPLMGTLLATNRDRVLAYLTYGNGMNKPGLVEAGGDVGGIETLVRHVLNEGYFDHETQAVVPLTPTGLGRVLEAAKPGSSGPVEEGAGIGFQMHRINDLERFFSGIRGHLRERAGGLEGEVCLVCSDSGKTVSLHFSGGDVSVSSDPCPDRVVLTRRQLTQLVFGSHESLPSVMIEGPARALLNRLFPYYVPFWELDHC